jgi:hypothetical protein
MSYIVKVESDYPLDPGTYTFVDWISGLAYSDLNNLFPEITEADWPTIKAEIIDTMKTPWAEAGVTPGLIDYVVDSTPATTCTTMTFDSEASFTTFNNARKAKSVHGIVSDFSVQLNKVDATTRFVVSGRSVYNTSSGYTHPFAPVGEWLTRTYQLKRGCITTVEHTTT